jgi:hypothetical protein
VIETAQLFWISTVGTDGRPHVTPLVAVWDEGALHFNTSHGSQKEINLRSNRHVTLTTGSSESESGFDVVVEGDGVRVVDDGTLHRLASAWATKWNGVWKFGVLDGCFVAPDGQVGVLVFSVSPKKVFTFRRGESMGQTRHVF